MTFGQFMNFIGTIFFFMMIIFGMYKHYQIKEMNIKAKSCSCPPLIYSPGQFNMKGNYFVLCDDKLHIFDIGTEIDSIEALNE